MESKNINISQAEINAIIDEYRKTNSVANEFKHVLISTDHYFIQAFANDRKDKIQNIRYNYDDEEYEYCTFDYVDSNCVITVQYFPFSEEAHKIMLVFYNDRKVIEKMFESVETFYEIGTYYLKRGFAGYSLNPINLKDENDPILNDDLAAKIKDDIDTFFSKKDFYEQNKMAFKRGILLYGPPGCGKTSLIRSIMRNHPDTYGIVIDCTRDFERDIGEFLKQVLGEKKKIIVLEDIDGVEPYSRSAILNFLDGMHSIENTFIVATTNYVHKVDEALVNRPSRFDRLYKVDAPDKEARKKLLLRFFPDLTETVLDTCISKTDGFSGAYFKEIFIFANLHRCSVEEAIGEIQEQMRLFKEKENETYFG